MIDSAQIDAEADSGVLVVRLKCEKLAEYETPIIEQEVRSLAPGFHWKVALDFGQVQMISSVGLGMLVSLQRACKAGNGKLALFAMNANLRMIMKVTRLDSGFTIKDDRPVAVKACA
ncbi:MAG: STAS domain-containing protein [Phycisphaerales bacterium]